MSMEFDFTGLPEAEITAGAMNLCASFCDVEIIRDNGVVVISCHGRRRKAKIIAG